MDRNELDGLLALKLVAEKRNFTAAAHELRISPAAISKLIRQLERRLGVTLLSRTTRSTSLTEPGEKFLSHTGPAIDQILEAIRGVSAFTARPSGLLRINLPRTTFHPFLKPLLAGFAREYPEITLELFLSDDTDDIVAGGFDAGIRHSDILAKDMVALRISDPFRFVVVGAKKYLARHGRPKTPKDLLGHNCLRLRFEDQDIYDRWEFTHKGRDSQVQVKGSFIVNDPMILIELAQSGLGLTYAAEDGVREAVKAGKLEIILEAYAAESQGYYLYYPQRSQVSPKLRAFIEYFRKNATLT